MQYICVNQINEHGLRKFRHEFWNIDRNTDQPIIPIVIATMVFNNSNLIIFTALKLVSSA